MSKRFMHVAIAFLCLALAYHFGSKNAGAQAPGNPVVGVSAVANTGGVVAMTANGDIYFSPNSGQLWYQYANCFSGATPVHADSWGKLKARYR
jgi:hypothetical protein